ncbi:MAG TPA: hypothetical protein VJ799_06635 [Nitrososphaeraceae archaeon]|nr:hypothetical protein [Nitrososphaeraceae archaeon]
MLCSWIKTTSDQQNWVIPGAAKGTMPENRQALDWNRGNETLRVEHRSILKDKVRVLKELLGKASLLLSFALDD